MLRDNLASRSEIFNHGEGSYYSRPLMVIVDRTDNPAIPLYHTTSYLVYIYIISSFSYSHSFILSHFISLLSLFFHFYLFFFMYI